MDADLIALILIGVAILVGLGTIAATVMLLVRGQPETADDDLADKEPAADDELVDEIDASEEPAQTSASLRHEKNKTVRK